MAIMSLFKGFDSDGSLLVRDDQRLFENIVSDCFPKGSKSFDKSGVSRKAWGQVSDEFLSELGEAGMNLVSVTYDTDNPHVYIVAVHEDGKTISSFDNVSKGYKGTAEEFARTLFGRSYGKIVSKVCRD